jgi:hypothetical protein
VKYTTEQLKSFRRKSSFGRHGGSTVCESGELHKSNCDNKEVFMVEDEIKRELFIV